MKAGVSVSTVSRVINNSPNVNVDTRSRILQIMEETGYVITPEVPKFVEVETSPKANKQNITLRYTALVPYKLLSQVKPIGGEDNEVEEVKWIDIRKLNNYKWAFNHNKIIERIILLKQYIQNDRHKHFS